jgi:putative membrane protein insertion efficiency factor
VTRASLLLIRGYQRLLGPLLGGMCRFEPTCSRYGYAALERFGFGRGWWLTIRRLARCRPFGDSGWDPVPDVYPTWRQRRREHRGQGCGQGGSA